MCLTPVPFILTFCGTPSPSAVHFLRNGADIRHIQEFLGHADLDTTKIYPRLVPGRLKEDYDAAFPEIAVGA